MRGVKIFSGSSHPLLTEAICERLGASPAEVELRELSNGETSVNIGVSVRNLDVYIVQSGSSKINDSVMELLIMISACKGGSAKSITGEFPADEAFFIKSDNANPDILKPSCRKTVFKGKTCSSC
jgi:ribose-phosphate pyrophosphokinase